VENVVGFLNGFNLQTIISVVLVAWYFCRDVKNEMKILEAKIERQSERTDQLYTMFIDLLKTTKGN
jgi:hypothetical protein